MPNGSALDLRGFSRHGRSACYLPYREELMKYRVIETTEGTFYPQFKPGFFSFWRFFRHDAENNIDSGWMLQRSIETDDSASAIVFGTEGEAQAFITRIDEKSKKYWADDTAKRIREIQGVNVKKVHKGR